MNLRTFVDVSEAKGCGESLDAVSREIGVEIYWLKRWRDKALAAMDAGLKEPMQPVGFSTGSKELVLRRVRPACVNLFCPLTLILTQIGGTYGQPVPLTILENVGSALRSLRHPPQGQHSPALVRPLKSLGTARFSALAC